MQHSRLHLINFLTFSIKALRLELIIKGSRTYNCSLRWFPLEVRIFLQLCLNSIYTVRIFKGMRVLYFETYDYVMCILVYSFIQSFKYVNCICTYSSPYSYVPYPSLYISVSYPYSSVSYPYSSVCT